MLPIPLLVFSRNIEDPNYMPVTRDMSKGKVDTLIKWLSEVVEDPESPLLRGDPVPAPPTPTMSSRATQQAAIESTDFKSAMAAFAQRGSDAPPLVIKNLDEEDD